MKHPHLRVNKAVDRLAFIDAIRRLEKLWATLSEYSYYGLGGDFLEDFRLMYELCPEIKLVSIEEKTEILKRQEFHLPCGHVELVEDRLESFLSQYTADDELSIFWLDYQNLEYSRFDEFKMLLGKITEGSMVKITLRANPLDYDGRRGAALFLEQFRALLPSGLRRPPRQPRRFARLLQEMLEVAAQEAFRNAGLPFFFFPVSSFRYSDGTPMYTLTGVKCKNDTEQVEGLPEAYKPWEFANVDWATPRLIDVPILSTKERLHLQGILPCPENPGETLRLNLGYLIDEENEEDTERKFKQYADYHRYAPYFMRAVP